MDITNIPIVDFLKYCKQGAKEKGYYWIACIICRSSDSDELYSNIIKDWQSLDCITGKRLLVLFAGNENKNSAITNPDGWWQRSNPFATIIGENAVLEMDISSKRHDFLRESLDSVESSQTDAVDSLMTYFNIEEYDVPCLVYIPLYKNEYAFDNIIVPIPTEGADLYKYFKRIFNDIASKIKCLSLDSDNLIQKIETVYDELIEYIGDKPNKETLIQYIEEQKYYKCAEPFRGKLSRYVDYCKEYENRYNKKYSKNDKKNIDLLQEIEEVFVSREMCKMESKSVDAYINIGNKNVFKNSPINVIIQCV